ncbi:endonuclease/exonuclease/phosphatase family protein [Salinirubellus sp. GCM10025818]|uniref:endonuclease/exonuclease/phosphatase family protein n=1 Tax=Salinirubellus TaxID=2162630 RepID=UPI0030D4F536
MSEDPPSPITRRAVLGSAAGLTAVASLTGRSMAAQSATTRPTVLTRNVYLGVDLFRLFRAESAAAFRRIAGELLESVDPDVYEARADAIAGEVAATDADVVALQEAALLRTQRPGDFGSASPEPATDVLVDFLGLVESALADRDLDYEVAAVTTTTDVELPADADGRQVDVRLTDRDAILVRGDLETADATAETFETSLPLPLPGGDRTVSLERGYCAVDVTVDGVAFRAVSTHLESVSPEARLGQARELLAALPDDRPVVVGGDFNSGPGTDPGTYELLTAELGDAYAVLGGDSGGGEDGEGFTCCQASSLRNDRSRLDERIDALLYRGRVRPVDLGRIGHRPEDRIEVRIDGGTVRLWPSDHAGVVGTFEVAAPTPTVTPTATPTSTAMGEPTATGTPTPANERTATTTAERTPTEPSSEGTPVTTSDGSGPGMGVLAALAGLSGAVARLRRD